MKFTIVVEAINDTHRFNARISLTLADNTLKELKDGEYNYLNIETLDHVDDYDFLNSSFIMTYAQTNIPGKALYVERGSFVVTTVKKEKHVKGTFTLTTGETMLINFYI